MPFVQARGQKSRLAHARSSSHGIASIFKALSKRSTRRGSPPWRISLVIDSARLTAEITECSRAALTFSHPCSRLTSAITAELSSAYRGCSVFNFTSCLFATLGNQFVRPHLGWRSEAAEVFLRFEHGSHPGFEHDPPGAAFRDTHRRARLHAELLAQRSGDQHPSRAIYFAGVPGSRFARHVPISLPSDSLPQSAIHGRMIKPPVSSAAYRRTMEPLQRPFNPRS